MKEQQNKEDFIGRGWSFPPLFQWESGTVTMTEQREDIERSLQILLSTRPGERVMQPRYGCALDELVFENLDTGTRTLIIDKIRTAILYWEPRIEAERIDLVREGEWEGRILIELDYRIRSTNSRFNFTFPFYKGEGTELRLLTTRQRGV